MTRSIVNYDRDVGWPGLVAPNAYPYIPATTALVANRAYVARFVPSRDMTITKIAFFLVTAALSTDAVDVGIYSSGFVRLVSSGATTGKLGTTGNLVQTVTVSTTTLTAGTTYFAALSSNCTASLFMATWPGSAGITFFGFTAAYRAADHVYEGTPGHPLAADISGDVNIGTTAVPLLAVRES